MAPRHHEFNAAEVGDRANGDDGALDGFLRSYPLPFPSSSRTSNRHLPTPVVIPQRRPGDKERGFVEAYAPGLEQFGIQQAEFIDFIRAANKAVRGNKWLSAVQLGAMGTSFIPNSIALGASVAVQLVAGVIAKAETRWRTNSFLDRTNEEYFRPRGLYCLLMAYTPVKIGEQAQFNIDEAAISAQPVPSESSSSTEDMSLTKRARKNLRDPIVFKVNGEDNLPSNVAPLVYAATSNADDESAKSAKNFMTRINNYLDDRAQAKYAKESGGDVLAHPSPPSFKNRYLDPNHPATNGGLLGLVSGGTITLNVENFNQQMQSTLDAQNELFRDQQSAMIDIWRQQIKLMNLPPDQEQAFMSQYEGSLQLQQQLMNQKVELGNSDTGQIRTILKVSYLMIVELPSDEQIATARRSLQDSDGTQFTPEITMMAVDL